MNHPRIGDLTVTEFKELLRETMAQSFTEMLGDPDEGLELHEDFAEELRRSLADVRTDEQTSNLSDVVSRLESNK
ncbi:MAG: hypothetical protein OXF97_01485 [Nitrospira sp.]|nr:hypothetical protein [Nitrospira sp.]MCY3956607.1 hypothetical protein [Nitrospira sp.]MCY4132977.1 hypothetical protein [Nitrospira sp.]